MLSFLLSSVLYEKQVTDHKSAFGDATLPANDSLLARLDALQVASGLALSPILVDIANLEASGMTRDDAIATLTAGYSQLDLNQAGLLSAMSTTEARLTALEAATSAGVTIVTGSLSPLAWAVELLGIDAYAVPIYRCTPNKEISGDGAFWKGNSVITIQGMVGLNVYSGGYNVSTDLNLMATWYQASDNKLGVPFTFTGTKNSAPSSNASKIYFTDAPGLTPGNSPAYANWIEEQI
jgi:hypothetical protein